MQNEEEKRYYYFMLLQAEAMRDYCTGSIRQIDHLIQLGPPNFDLKEPECDLYKVSISFDAVNGLIEDMVGLMGTSHRVLFQNSKDDIIMGVWFNDPNIRLEDIFWYCELAKDICNAKNKELIFVDEKLKTKSCFIELHRTG